MSPVGYFFGGEQFPEQAAAGALAAETEGVGFTSVHAPLALGLAASGDVLPAEAAAAAGLVDYGGPTLRTPAPVTIAAAAVAFTLALGGTDELPVEAPSLPTGADETGWFQPSPPFEVPVVTVFAGPDELVEFVAPGPIYDDAIHSQTLFQSGLAIRFADSGDALPGAVAPTVPPEELYDPLALTDPVVIASWPTIIFWLDEVLPGGVAPSLLEQADDHRQLIDPVVVATVDTRVFVHQETLPGAGIEVEQVDDPLALTDPVVVTTVTPAVVTDQDVLPGAVAPTMFERPDDLRFLVDPVVVGTVDARVVTDQEVLPGAVVPTLFEQADDHRDLTAPVVVETITPRVFTTTDELPGAVAPTLFEQADDLRFLTAPVVITTTDARAISDQETLPEQALFERADDLRFLTDPVVITTVDTRVFADTDVHPLVPIWLHDEAGPPGLHMLSLPAPLWTQILGEPEVWPSGIPVLVPSVRHGLGIDQTTRHRGTDNTHRYLGDD